MTVRALSPKKKKKKKKAHRCHRTELYRSQGRSVASVWLASSSSFVGRATVYSLRKMSTLSFLVGVTASGVASFAVVEMLADRRCLSFRRRSQEEFILSSIYKAVRCPDRILPVLYVSCASPSPHPSASLPTTLSTLNRIASRSLPLFLPFSLAPSPSSCFSSCTETERIGAVRRAVAAERKRAGSADTATGQQIRRPHCQRGRLDS